MSKMIPQATIDALRKMVDVSVDAYGTPCTLFIPNNLDELDANDIYIRPSEIEYDTYETLIWIEWSPNAYRLRNMGLFTEGDLPILARFGRDVTASNSTIQQVDVIKGSYIAIAPQYVPDKFEGQDEFEIVDVLIGKMHDAIVAKLFKIAPRRIPT